MKQSVSLLVRNAKGRVLIIQRSSDCKNFKDWWEFPGGKIDPGESPRVAVCRESAEEVGLNISPDAIEPEPVWRNRVPNGSVEYAFFTWKSAEENPAVSLSHEHSASKWVTPTEARRLQMMAPHREFLERVWHQEQIQAFEKVQPRYVLLQQTLEKVLRRMSKEWSPLAIVQARAKSVSSFAEKCLRKADKYDDPVNQLTDLCGGRVVAPVTDEAEAVCRQIRQLFGPVDEDDDTSRRHAAAAFGYLSVHFIVHFRAGQKEMLGITVPPEVAGLKAEIQVRTLLQHAHSEVTHDRLYKSGFKVPSQFEREAARIAALLEEADSTFARFVGKLDAYVGHYATHLEPAARQREQDNLRLVIEHEPDAGNKPALALRRARLARVAWDWKGVVEALETYAEVDSLAQPDIWMELGNALCRLHRDTQNSPAYRRGLELLSQVAQPRVGPETPVESRPRGRRATALGWLGSALAKSTGHRAEARHCLSRAVELAPDNPYHLAAFVELDVVASGTDDHLPLLAPALRQAAGRCVEHIQAGIEMTRAWLTLSKIRLLSDDNIGAFEALCVALRHAESHHPLTDYQRSLDSLQDAIGNRRPFIQVLNQTAILLVRARQNGLNPCTAEQWLPLVKQFDYAGAGRVLILAGSTAQGSEVRLQQFEPGLRTGLEGFTGAILTGGSDAGICGLATRLTADLNSKAGESVNLVGYLPHAASASTAFKHLVRTADTQTFSALEPVQMWTDLLSSCVRPSAVTLLCLGGGEISSEELALAWALGARTVVVGDGSEPTRRFAALLDVCGANIGRGMILPNDVATLAALIAYDRPMDPNKWEKPGIAVHQAYLEERSKHPTQSNLVPWKLLRVDFKHSTRQQAACAADILRRSGFDDIEANATANQIPLPEFTPEEIEHMAEMEHGRWNVERLDSGWRHAEKKDESRKLSPYLVPWQNVPEAIKDYDRQAVCTWPGILAQAGLQVIRR